MIHSSRHQNDILIVDDTPENLTVLRRILTEHGYHIRPVLNGELALKTVQKVLPDLILLDIMMPPGINGYEVCQRLKADKRTRDIPVLFISALDDTMDKVKAFDVGGLDYITKPFQEEEVLARVRTHLNLRNMQTRLQKQNRQLQQEIAERQQAEKALRRLEKAVETTGIGITITDNEGKIVYTNPADAKMHGYKVDELIGQPSNVLTKPEFRERKMTRDEDAEIFHNWERERINMRKDGSVFPVRLTSNPIYDTKRYRLGTVTVCEDITDQKRVEEAMRNAKEAALEAKNAAEAANRSKSTFLANMSHELRTPLNTIIGFAQIMAYDQNLSSEQQENLSIINRSGEHLLTLINQVLDLSKIEAGKITLDETNFDFYRLLEDLEDIFRLRANKKGLHLLFDRAADIPCYVHTDEVKLRQVLINLLNNAIKFTERGGVTVRIGISDCELRIANLEDHKSEIRNLKFEISDTGPGIAPEEMNRVFEAFAQTETGRHTQEGTGLGLSISKKFVQLMGGDITVHSEVGHGTTFTFTIQAGVVETPAIERKQPDRRVVALEPNQPRYRILIVDDKPDNRKVLVKFLLKVESPLSDPSKQLRAGFELREAANGQEAFDIWKIWYPHLIWMDIRMPVMNGYEAAKRIKAAPKGQETVIIIVTASSFEEEQAVVFSAGCDDFLRKPFREAEIFEMMRKHLGVRFVYEESNKVASSKVAGSRQKAEEKEILTPEALAALPKELRTELQQAVEVIDMKRANSLIERVRQQDTPLADALAELMKNYRFDILQGLFEEIE